MVGERTCIRMRRSALCFFSNRWSEKRWRACCICWRSSGDPSSGWKCQTWRPTWLLRVESHPPAFEGSAGRVSAPILSCHIFWLDCKMRLLGVIVCLLFMNKNPATQPTVEHVCRNATSKWITKINEKKGKPRFFPDQKGD